MCYRSLFFTCLLSYSLLQGYCTPATESGDKKDVVPLKQSDKPATFVFNDEDGSISGSKASVDTKIVNKELLPSLNKNANHAALLEGTSTIESGLNDSATKDIISEAPRVLDKDMEVAWVEGNITLKANTTFEEIERNAKEYMKHVNDELGKEANKYTLSSWLFGSNITDHNKNISIDGKIKYGAYKKRAWTDLQTWKELWPKFTNDTLKRQFKLQSVLGVPALSSDKYAELSALLAELSEIYSTGTICDYTNLTKCDLNLEPDIVEIMANSRNYDELTHVWKSWRDSVGRPMRTLYPKYVALGNEAAELNGFKSLAELWTHSYEDNLFEDSVKDLYQQMKPLYNQLHAYTRRKLREVYGAEKVPKKGPIPAHLLGNMWAQSWDRIYDLLTPYPNKTSIEVKDAMVSQNYTPTILFEKADDFFASLGLDRVSPLFWNNSILEKPTDRKIVCHASAWDFYDGKDFRIKQCAIVNRDHFETAHHEMGHIQYYLQYNELPPVFKDGANPGFHEAIGDVMFLSVTTPKHLHKVGLLESIESDYEADINFLMSSALKKVAFLPFAYMIDRFRWDTFRGLISPDNYTCSWWNYRYEIQGITPPVQRTEEDFDPGAKNHVATNSQYIQYFVSYVLQFQFHKSLCLLAGEYDPLDPQKPLHQCDIYQSTNAGKELGDLLQLGSSKHWTIPLKKLTGTDKMDLSALMEYFKPLEQWLKEDNKKHGEFIGWEGGHGVC